MCSHSQLSSRIALIIGAWMPGLETPQQFHHQDSLCETFSKTWKRINQPRISQEVLLFLSTNPNIWVHKYGAVSLVNETFENVRSLPSTRVNRGARQVNPRRLGILSYITTLRKTFGCAILRSCLRVSPTTARTRRRRSPNNTGAAVLSSSSPPWGAVKTPTNQVSCIVPYIFRRMSIRLRSCRCGTHHNAETKLAPVFQSQCSKGQESLPFPPEPMLRRNKKD